MSWYSGPYYAPTTPRKVAGGLKLRGKKGVIADTWWGRRWTQALESFGWHTRLERGRRYARSGQVASIKIGPGRVLALVQGSKPKPYAVEIRLHAISRKDWSRLSDAIARQALFTAKLLSGEMPPEIEKTFLEAKLALFPQSKHDLSTDCSCPDWENPCKHIAATYYILAQEFDRDPFLLFNLRGISREELLRDIRSRRRKAPLPSDPDQWVDSRPRAASERTSAREPKAPRSVDLSGREETFFQLSKELPAGLGPSAEFIERLPKSAGKVREMGTPPFWRGELIFESTLTQYYKLTRDRALALVRESAKPAASAISSPRRFKRSAAPWATPNSLTIHRGTLSRGPINGPF
ncbi:MAG: SWIM zinc finger family protein [Elusimicrobia bacterium]|nr:SWIM zinc finger family protein [Elusimicrobiota bacterium]